jgi:hypothetical protein
VSACVLCWWGVLALVHAGVCFGRDLGLFVGRRAGGGSGGGAGKDALFVELWKACAGPLATVPPLGEKVYYFPQGHIEQVSAQLPGGRTLFPLMVVVLFFQGVRVRLESPRACASESSPNFAQFCLTAANSRGWRGFGAGLLDLGGRWGP